MDTYDVAVVGGGPGGLAAAMYSRMRGLSAVTFEAEAFGGQLINLYPTKPVDNFPAQTDVASGELAKRLADQASRFGAELAEWEPVEHVGRDGRSFALRTGRRTVAAAALVLALGLGRFAPRRLELPDEQRFLDRGLVYRMPPLDAVTVRRVVIVGGGDSAVDTALSLQERHHVTLVHRRRDLRAHGRSLERLMDSRVDVVTDAEVVELCGKHHLESVVLSHADDSAQELPTDLLLVSIGQIPDLAGVRTWDITLPEPHIGVSPAMETALAGVFAAGDYAVYPGKVKMIATAVAEGSTAAASVERYLMTPAA